MREIRFRAWDKKNQRYIYAKGEFISVYGPLSFTLDGQCYVNGVLQDVELEQYIGIKDSKGVAEIYEGDIVKCGTGEPGVVQWLAPAFGVYRKGGWVRHLWPEEEHVLGNIHEHKHLLEAEE